MPISSLLRSFDVGVANALAEYSAVTSTPNIATEFNDIFAAFAFYDVQSASDSGVPPLFARLDEKHREPLLWQHIHRSLSQLLRDDEDLGPLYAGFGTLFTINHAASRDATSPIPRYPSLTVDADLGAPGLYDLALSRKQFVERTTFPLTAVCLNTTNDLGFATMPVVFHWTRASSQRQGNAIAARPPELQSWGHIFVNADIPYSVETGIATDLREIDFNSQYGDNPVQIADGALIPEVFYSRLHRYAEFVRCGIVNDADVSRRLAWTVTYFAYACERYVQRRIGVSAEPLNELSIVCAPASFNDDASSALYVPLNCSPGQSGRAAVKVLYLARALAMPLMAIRDASEAWRVAQSDILDSFAHEAKPLLHLLREWPRPADELFLLRGHGNGVIATPRGGDLELANCRVISFPHYFHAAMSQVIMWTMAESKADLPFYRASDAPSARLPNDLSSLAAAAFETATLSVLLAFVRDLGHKATRSASMVAQLDAYLRGKLPSLHVSTFEAAASVKTREFDLSLLRLNWTDFSPQLTNLSRLLIVAFREAIEHGSWTAGVRMSVTFEMSASQTPKLHLRIVNDCFDVSPPTDFNDVAIDGISSDELAQIRRTLGSSTFNPTRTIGPEREGGVGGVGNLAHGRTVLTMLARRLAMTFHPERQGPLWIVELVSDPATFIMV